MNKKTIVQIASIATIFSLLCAFCFSFIAMVLALIIDDAVHMLLSAVLMLLSALGIWFLLKAWKAPTDVFEPQVGSISKKEKKGRGVKKP